MMYSKDDIVKEARELGRMIANTEQVEFFKKAEAKIHEHEEVRKRMASLKSLQKQAVNFQQYGKEKALQMTEEKIKQIEDELEEMPIVDQFKKSQTEVNTILQMVSHAISSTVTEEVIKSTGGDLLKGQTGAEVAAQPKHDIEK